MPERPVEYIHHTGLVGVTKSLPEVPMVTLIPGLSPLARILLDHYCRLTATCVHLFTVDLYPITCKDDISTEMSCV